MQKFFLNVFSDHTYMLKCHLVSLFQNGPTVRRSARGSVVSRNNPLVGVARFNKEAATIENFPLLAPSISSRHTSISVKPHPFFTGHF